MVMRNEELAKLKMKSQYDDAINDWQIPVFLLKNKEIALPSLSIKKQAMDYMDDQKDQRTLVFENEQVESDNSSGSAKRNVDKKANSYMS